MASALDLEIGEEQAAEKFQPAEIFDLDADLVDCFGTLRHGESVILPALVVGHVPRAGLLDRA
ncbi:hypothetical protein D3C72_2271860 [compost metagenome]